MRIEAINRAVDRPCLTFHMNPYNYVWAAGSGTTLGRGGLLDVPGGGGGGSEMSLVGGGGGVEIGFFSQQGTF